MGRPKRHSGGHSIHHAEEMFRQSVANRNPDYSYVALAIGAAPQAPPSWAVLACIELRQQRERQPARGNAAEIEGILDDMVRFYDRDRRAFELTCTESPHALDGYRAPALRSAILQVLKANGQRSEQSTSASDDWFRDIRKAWEWEQEHDLAPSSFMELDEGGIGKDRKLLKTTTRIDRVLMQSIAAEMGDPVDVQTWAWITKRMIQNATIEQQKPDQPDM